ncbi:MAG TPA: UDP-N-acetylmuramoyl-L-alanyl-D-glutamate--2,6-diaminopimelate ligase [Pilimelia sp.]|nr:UDP-N-acetylmuramoyl-L-alanyl-D-glutamate--2,6-diaminopimelate ligase [Pilimelia sp.]
MRWAGAETVGSSAVPGNPRPRTVTPTRLADLATLLPVVSPGEGAPDVAVAGVTHASDAVQPGDLYAALPGARRHGAEFVAAAAGAGAVAVLTDPAGAAAAATAGLPALVVPDPRAVLGDVASRIYGDPTADLTVIGLTGTAGKTTTAYLVESGLRADGRVTGLIGTVETRLADVTLDSARTTPEATDLHAMLAFAREQGVRAVVMEVSSHALAMGRVGGVRFDVGGWTNFGLDHLDFHADVQDYFAAKARLFDGRCRTEILNLDEEALRRLIHAGTVTYSAVGDPAATWRAIDVAGSDTQRFTAVGPGVSVPAGVGLPGRHNVANALLAIASLVAIGVAPDVAAAGVARLAAVPGRMERLATAGPVLGVVDYAHKPDSIVAVLAALRAVSAERGGRLICVIGAGGDRDRAKRPLMGKAAAAGADLVVVTDDNPRTEDPAAIRAEVLAGARAVAGGAEVVEVPGRREAVDEAVRRAGPGDVIALLGKGHERGQEIGGQTFPFDDRDVLAAALEAHVLGGAR